MNNIDTVKELTKEFEKWLGYCEKKSTKYLGTNLDSPGDFTIDAGYENNTIFAKVYLEMTGIAVQGQPWCDTFIDTIFIHFFGLAKAKELLGGFSAYTPTSANYFKTMNRFYTGIPSEGDIIFYKNSTRIYHTGYVVSCDGKTLVTIEGNTSNGTSVVENGGVVAKKTYNYSATKSRIAGFGRPNYVIAFEPGFKLMPDNSTWKYMELNGKYLKSCVVDINGLRFAFDSTGNMVTGQCYIDGVRRYFGEKKGVEGAEYVVSDNGFKIIQEVT